MVSYPLALSKDKNTSHAVLRLQRGSEITYVSEGLVYVDPGQPEYFSRFCVIGINVNDLNDETMVDLLVITERHEHKIYCEYR